MMILVFAVLVAAYMAYFATQNTQTVILHFAPFGLVHIPLYAAIIATLLIGLLISWIISLLQSFGSAVTIHGKNKNLRDADNTIAHLKKEIQDLKIQNEHIHGEKKLVEERAVHEKEQLKTKLTS